MNDFAAGMQRHYEGSVRNVLEASRDVRGDLRLFNNGEGLVERLADGEKFGRAFMDTSYLGDLTFPFNKRANLVPVLIYGRSTTSPCAWRALRRGAFSESWRCRYTGGRDWSFLGAAPTGHNQVTANCLPWFSGTAQTCHGEIALPAPATLRLMQGKPVCPGEENWEIVTPTGALLLDCIVNSFEPAPGGIFLKNSLGYRKPPQGQGPGCFYLKTLRPARKIYPTSGPS